MTYCVVLRVCETGDAVNQLPRPWGLSKRQTILLTLRSLVASLEAADIEYGIYVVEDGISDALGDELSKWAEAIVSTDEQGVCGSLSKSYEVAQGFSDGNWVYLCDDEYLHRGVCMQYIDELLSGATEYLQSYDRELLFIHPCDYPDRYSRPDPFTGLSDDGYSIFRSGLCHWREVPSATYTWLMRAEVLRRHAALFRDNIDHHARFGTGGQYWGEVVFQREDALCISPLPSLSTHLHEGFMSPLIDWKAEAARFDWSL